MAQLEYWRRALSGFACERGLLQSSVAQAKELPLDALISSLRTVGGWKMFELSQDYVAKHGWDVSLVEALQHALGSLGTQCNYTERARGEWFLWFEDVAPIELAECWSHRIQQDLRAMPASRSKAWRTLLDNPCFALADEPPKKWRKVAEPAFQQIDAADFRSRFAQWFEPFAQGEPLRLTISGRNILRVLMWYALLAKDARVDAALAGFAHAKWKTKQAAERASQAEMAFAYVLAERMPEKALDVLEAQLESGRAFQKSSTDRIYQSLCNRFGRKPLAAKPAASKRTQAHDGSAAAKALSVAEDLRRALEHKKP